MGDNAVSFGILDHTELRCCDGQMRRMPNRPAYKCFDCGWVVWQSEFLRSAHLSSVEKAIARREIGQAGDSL